MKKILTLCAVLISTSTFSMEPVPSSSADSKNPIDPPLVYQIHKESPKENDRRSCGGLLTVAWQIYSNLKISMEYFFPQPLIKDVPVEDTKNISAVTPPVMEPDTQSQNQIMENVGIELPYRFIQRTHVENGLDFLGGAIQAAEMRARYNRTSMNILSSKEIPLKDRLAFALTLTPSDKIRYSQHVELIAKVELARSQGQEASSDYSQIKKEISLSNLAGKIDLDEDLNAEQSVVLERLVELSKTTDIWEFLHRSLKLYATENRAQSPDFTSRLFNEFINFEWMRRDLLLGVQKLTGKDMVQDKRLGEDSLFMNYISECVLLHAELNLKLTDKDIPLSRLTKLSLTDVNSRPSIGYYFLALSDFQGHPYGPGGADCILQPSPSARSHSLGTRVRKEWTELWAKAEKEGWFFNSHVRLLCRAGNSTYGPTAVKRMNNARQFTLTNGCLSFDEYHAQILESDKQKYMEATKEQKEQRANSFLPKAEKLIARKPSQNKHKKGSKKSHSGDDSSFIPENRQEESPDLMETKTEIAPTAPAGSSPAAVPATAVKKDLPTKKQKRDAKRLEEQQAQALLLNERQAVADRNKQAHERMIAGIRVVFSGKVRPSLDELNIYSCIWGPASARKTLCWGDLRSQLQGHGWTVSYNEGSYVILTPPLWFSHVRVAADAALQINFRNTKFMIHKPHDDVLAPMPTYVIAFMREAFESAIGLSEIVVDAMIKEAAVRAMNKEQHG